MTHYEDFFAGRSTEDLEFFAVHGYWPNETDDANPVRAAEVRNLVLPQSSTDKRVTQPRAGKGLISMPYPSLQLGDARRTTVSIGSCHCDRDLEGGWRPSEPSIASHQS